MIATDYDYLRKFLRERSGLVLSADKEYLVESRLLPVARRAGTRECFRAGSPDMGSEFGISRPAGGRGNDNQ